MEVFNPQAFEFAGTAESTVVDNKLSDDVTDLNIHFTVVFLVTWPLKGSEFLSVLFI